MLAHGGARVAGGAPVDRPAAAAHVLGHRGGPDAPACLSRRPWGRSPYPPRGYRGGTPALGLDPAVARRHPVRPCRWPGRSGNPPGNPRAPRGGSPSAHCRGSSNAPRGRGLAWPAWLSGRSDSGGSRWSAARHERSRSDGRDHPVGRPVPAHRGAESSCSSPPPRSACRPRGRARRRESHAPSRPPHPTPTTGSKQRRPPSGANRRPRCLGKVGGTKLGSIRGRSRNHRTTRVESSSSQTARSLRTEDRASKRDPFQSRSGQKSLRGERRAAALGIHRVDQRLVDQRRPLHEHLVGQGLDGPQRMVPGDPLFPIDKRPHQRSGLVSSAHRCLPYRAGLLYPDAPPFR
jgi:hypothetical protein